VLLTDTLYLYTHKFAREAATYFCNVATVLYSRVRRVKELPANQLEISYSFMQVK